ncbi:MAG TPA: hypothetical protein VGX46_19805 [Vicinamibacterales bacterium]|jgi:hypothetical protein|nr:hypothetical protein [Vicinamibacterales bacterium]
MHASRDDGTCFKVGGEARATLPCVDEIDEADDGDDGDDRDGDRDWLFRF